MIYVSHMIFYYFLWIMHPLDVYSKCPIPGTSWVQIQVAEKMLAMSSKYVASLKNAGVALGWYENWEGKCWENPLGWRAP